MYNRTMSPNTASPLSRFGYRASVPSRGKGFFAPPKCQHWLRGPPPSYSMRNGSYFTSGKPAGAWSWPLTQIKALRRVHGQHNFTFSIPCITIHLLQLEPSKRTQFHWSHNNITTHQPLHVSDLIGSSPGSTKLYKNVCIRWIEMW